MRCAGVKAMGPQLVSRGPSVSAAISLNIVEFSLLALNI